MCAFSLGVPALSSAWLGAVSHSSFRAFVRYWPVLMSAVSPTSRCFFGPRLCALRACLAAFLRCLRRGLWPYISSPSGPRFLPLLASRAAAFLSCSRQGVWPFLLYISHSFVGPRRRVPLASPAAFLLSPRCGLWPIHIFSFFGRRLCALKGLSCCVPLFSSVWPFLPLLTPTLCCFFRAWLSVLSACRAGFRV